jgi:hypothetical protein
VVALQVGKRTVVDYSLIVASVATLLVWGTNRMRFFVVWIVVTLLPVLLFTTGIASRYLYVSAAGLALLLADLILAAETQAARWISTAHGAHGLHGGCDLPGHPVCRIRPGRI